MGTMVSALFRESLPTWGRGPVAALTKREWPCVVGTALYGQKLGPSSNSIVKIIQASLRKPLTQLPGIPTTCVSSHAEAHILGAVQLELPRPFSVS